MDAERETELLMHVAAGTDSMTALAVLPCDDEAPVETPTEPSTKSSSGWIAFAVLIAIALWLLLR